MRQPSEDPVYKTVKSNEKPSLTDTKVTEFQRTSALATRASLVFLPQTFSSTAIQAHPK